MKTDDWQERRREILGIFAKEMFGMEPPPPEALEIEKFDERVSAAGGIRDTKQILEQKFPVFYKYRVAKSLTRADTSDG